MKRAHSIPQLQIMGHPIQIFADIPSIIQRRRSFKSLLTALQQKNIKYWWLFPSALNLRSTTNHSDFLPFLKESIFYRSWASYPETHLPHCSPLPQALRSNHLPPAHLLHYGKNPKPKRLMKVYPHEDGSWQLLLYHFFFFGIYPYIPL